MTAWKRVFLWALWLGRACCVVCMLGLAFGWVPPVWIGWIEFVSIFCLMYAVSQLYKAAAAWRRIALASVVGDRLQVAARLLRDVRADPGAPP